MCFVQLRDGIGITDVVEWCILPFVYMVKNVFNVLDLLVG